MRVQFQLLFALTALSGCVSHVLPLLPEPVPLTMRADVPLEVVTKLAGAQDPLHMAGSSWQFAELEHAVGRAVMNAAAPWADAHRAQREGGWQIQVELIKSDATIADGQARTSLGVRATLRAVVGQVFLGQTQVFSSTAGLAKNAAEAREVLWRCIGNVGRNVSGWLDGVTP